MGMTDRTKRVDRGPRSKPGGKRDGEEKIRGEKGMDRRVEVGKVG